MNSSSRNSKTAIPATLGISQDRITEKSTSRHTGDSDEDDCDGETPKEHLSPNESTRKRPESLNQSTCTSSSDESDASSVFELNPNSTMDEADAPAIALLRQIFPDESTQELRALHHQHVSVEKSNRSDQLPASQTITPSPESTSSNHDDPYQSKLGRRLWNDYAVKQQHLVNEEEVTMPGPFRDSDLPVNFLRLPTSVAVRRIHFDPQNPMDYPSPRYDFISDLQNQAMQEYSLRLNQTSLAPTRTDILDNVYTVVISRHEHIGLGLKLSEVPTSDVPRLSVFGFVDHPDNPCLSTQIQAGDSLMGVNGSSFPFFRPQQTPAQNGSSSSPMLQHAVRVIQQSPNPIVLHFVRQSTVCEQSTPSLMWNSPLPSRQTSLLDDVYTTRTPGTVDDLESITSASTITTTSITLTPPQPSAPQQEKTHKPMSFRPFQRARNSRKDQSAKVSTIAPNNQIHPFAKALTKRGLIRGDQDERQITQHLEQFSTRARQWETLQSLHIDALSHQVVVDDTAIERHDCDDQCAPSTPPLNDIAEYRDYHHHESDAAKRNNQGSSYPGNVLYSPAPSSTGHANRNFIALPLYNIRKALCARIVNTFLEESASRVAYTIWVYDVETAREWYAPIRYWGDFDDLRTACMALAPPAAGVADWEFPTHNNHSRMPSLFGFGSPSRRHPAPSDDSEEGRITKCRQLEHFLRSLCSMMYTCQPLSPDMVELAIHVQSFLGVEAGVLDATAWDTSPSSLYHSGSTATGGMSAAYPHSDLFTGFYSGSSQERHNVRRVLKMSLQRYTYRIFLLNVMKAIVNDFVDTTRARGPKLNDIENLQVRATLKKRASVDLERIQAFLDQLVDLIVDGCENEMRQIASRKHYRIMHPLIEVDTTDGYWERLVREAVREQVEIEVYVPLRSVVSRLLVNGWRHEDMEVQFKLKELRKRPQGMFRIPSDKTSPSHWQSVAAILKRGVGMSTLPSSKLRAIVDAAREISRLYQQEHGLANDHVAMGADDFLPIFIFCVVRAEMERPCALCVLLQTLCDRMNRIGEIGYFLASFEAAIAHIAELDLTEDQDEMLSFLSMPLTEVSLDE